MKCRRRAKRKLARSLQNKATSCRRSHCGRSSVGNRPWQSLTKQFTRPSIVPSRAAAFLPRSSNASIIEPRWSSILIEQVCYGSVSGRSSFMTLLQVPSDPQLAFPTNNETFHRPLPKRRPEQKRSRADAPCAVQVDLVEEALRADLREVLGSHVEVSRGAEWIAKGYCLAWCARWCASCGAESRTSRRWPNSTLRLPIGTESGRRLLRSAPAAPR